MYAPLILKVYDFRMDLSHHRHLKTFCSVLHFLYQEQERVRASFKFLSRETFDVTASANLNSLI